MLAIRDDARSMECRRLEMLPIECVVRGYVAGSAWKDYKATGATSGHTLPEGLRESEGSPSRSSRRPQRRRPGTTRTSAATRRRSSSAPSGSPRSSRSASSSTRPLRTTRATRGIIIADTKFELGLDTSGNLVLGDEALTPDSSRFWPADSYEPGRAQDSFDKQFVRDYCEQTGWDRPHPGPSCRRTSSCTRARSTSRRSNS